MYTNYWTVITWRRDWGFTWHVRCNLLILVTALLSLCALRLVKMTIKYFWFIKWPNDQSLAWNWWWDPLILSHPAKLGLIDLVKVEMWRLLHILSPRYWSVGWLCWCGPFILSHHLAKFGSHGLCESGDVTFFICHVPRYQIVAWLCT